VLFSESTRNVLVAGSLPPVFGSYRPELFQYERAKAITTELMQAQDENVDLWLAETVASVAEAKMYLELFNTTQNPAYFCFSFQDEITSLHCFVPERQWKRPSSNY
jgi:S-methylmethionine-dependent homocysteine/selenocysteine methylase